MKSNVLRPIDPLRQQFINCPLAVRLEVQAEVVQWYRCESRQYKWATDMALWQTQSTPIAECGITTDEGSILRCRCSRC